MRINLPISTSIEQSRRLLSCGVDPKTADMSVRTIREPYGDDMAWHIPKLLTLPYDEAKTIYGEDEITPAWSLSALCSLLPKRIKTNNACLTIVADYNDWNVGYEYDSLIGRGIETVKSFNAHSLIESCVQMIEWLTEHNYPLNKIEE